MKKRIVRVIALLLFAVVMVINVQTSKNENKQENEGLRVVASTEVANAVIIPIGHKCVGLICKLRITSENCVAADCLPEPL